MGESGPMDLGWSDESLSMTRLPIGAIPGCRGTSDSALSDGRTRLVGNAHGALWFGDGEGGVVHRRGSKSTKGFRRGGVFTFVLRIVPLPTGQKTAEFSRNVQLHILYVLRYQDTRLRPLQFTNGPSRQGLALRSWTSGEHAAGRLALF